jgi:hypothetical protein
MAILGFILGISALPTVAFLASLPPAANIYIQHLLNGDASVKIAAARDQFTIFYGLGSLNYSLSFVMIVAASLIVFLACLIMLIIELVRRKKSNLV